MVWCALEKILFRNSTPRMLYGVNKCTNDI